MTKVTWEKRFMVFVDFYQTVKARVQLHNISIKIYIYICTLGETFPY